jgi:hypothetical protein
VKVAVPRGELMCRAHKTTPAAASCARCGDFMCALCGPLSPRPLCGRCSARGAVDWEERGDQFWGRALVSTFWEALSGPRKLGRRLAGTGRVGWALGYAALSTFLGTLPLSLLIAALLMTVADPLTLGMRSTGVMSLAVSSVLASVGVATLLPLALLPFAGLLRLTAGLFGIDTRFDLLLRAASYGLSLLAVPLLGPLLLPIALLFMFNTVHAALSSQGQSGPAISALLSSCALLACPFALLWAL